LILFGQVFRGYVGKSTWGARPGVSLHRANWRDVPESGIARLLEIEATN
jgi:hypothetical protein